MVLDGEIVAFDEDGKPSFSALQGRMHLTGEARIRRLAKERPVRYVPFDLLWIDGHSLMHEPYRERRARLSELTGLDVPQYVEGEGEAMLALTKEQGLEGVIAKRLDSRYEPGKRTNSWIKIKNVQREELVVVGWEPGDGRRRERIGALLVAHPGSLRFAGGVGTGFTDAELDRLPDALEPLVRDSSPIATDGPAPPKGAVFVEPRLRCVVEFLEWTKDGVLRAPSYKGLVQDDQGDRVCASRTARCGSPTPPRCSIRRPASPSATCSTTTSRSPPVLLPHLRDRQLTLKRYPDGVDGQFFYEKNAPAHRPDWVRTDRSGLRRRRRRARRSPGWRNLADLELHTPLHRETR